jgi:predicted ester cyclase
MKPLTIFILFTNILITMKKLFIILIALIGVISVSAQETSTADQNIATVKKFYKILNQPDWKDHAGFLFTAENYEMFSKVHSGFREVFPDYHYEPMMITAKGDSVLTFGLVTGTHSKTWDLFPAIPATNKKISWLETGLIIMKDGKTTGAIILNDRLGIMNELGYGCKPQEFQ